MKELNLEDFESIYLNYDAKIESYYNNQDTFYEYFAGLNNCCFRMHLCVRVILFSPDHYFYPGNIKVINP